MVEVIPGPIIIEPATNRQGAQAQPVPALANLDPMIEETALRQAIANAEANNQDPLTLTQSDLAQAQVDKSAPKATEVPQKFLKPDGTADVEKIQASTRQLDEAIAKKEEAISKTVDDYMREYNERQTKFRTMPNAEKMAPASVAPLPPPVVADVPMQDFEEVVRRDYAADPLGTTTRLLDLMLKQKFAPFEEREQAEARRGNLQLLASKDPRILRDDIFKAINTKLREWEIDDPARLQLKNPHKAAWLEVKEEMRLGEPSQAPAQPRGSSPVLGGGTPPSVPSSSAPLTSNVIANIHTLDIRDKKQEEMGDAAIRAMLAGNRG